MKQKDLAALLTRAAAALEDMSSLTTEEMDELIEDLTSAARELVGDYDD